MTFFLKKTSNQFCILLVHFLLFSQAASTRLLLERRIRSYEKITEVVCKSNKLSSSQLIRRHVIKLVLVSLCDWLGSGSFYNFSSSSSLQAIESSQFKNGGDFCLYFRFYQYQ